MSGTWRRSLGQPKGADGLCWRRGCSINSILPDNVRCIDETVGQGCGDGAAKELSGGGHGVVDVEVLASCTYVGRFDIGTEEI